MNEYFLIPLYNQQRATYLGSIEKFDSNFFFYSKFAS